MAIAVTEFTPVEQTAFLTEYARALDSRWPRPILDDRVLSFTSEHPDAVVVDLGAGLDTGMQRVKPPTTVDWYSVDLPNVIALRDELVPAAGPAHSVAASVADDSWTDTIPADRPTMLIADGLLAFLPEDVT